METRSVCYLSIEWYPWRKISFSSKENIRSKLKELGLKIHHTKHALSGLEFIKQHPEKRAEDLIEAFSRKTTRIIWSIIGGNDIIKILPFFGE